MLPLLPSYLLTVAQAEPPPFVSLDDAVKQSSLVVVAEAKRVEFQALEPGQKLSKSSLDPHWVEYTVSEVLFAGRDQDVKVGDVLRVDFDFGGCEPYTLEIRRDGDRFLQRDADASQPTDIVLDPKHWLPAEPQILALNKPGEMWFAVGFGATPIAADEDGRAKIAKALKKR